VYIFLQHISITIIKLIEEEAFMKSFRHRIMPLILTFAMIISIIPFVEPVQANVTYVISNPYAHVVWTGTNAFRQYKAGLHTHTTNTDGRNTTSSTAERYYTLGYNILAFTDHNYTTQTPNLVATGAMSRTRINEMQAGAGRTGGANSGMIFVQNANERSGLNVPEIAAGLGNTNSHHLSSFWSNAPNRNEAVSATLTRMQEEGTGVAVLNHLGRNTGASYSITPSASASRNISGNAAIANVYANLFRNHRNLIGMEIINELDNETFTDRVLWDNILSRTMPEGIPVWGFSNDDSHANEHVGFSYNLMLMPSLSASEFKFAMESGAFFAFSRVDRNRGLHAGTLRTDDKNGGTSSRFTDALALPAPTISNIVVSGNTITITASGGTVEWFSGTSSNNNRRVGTGNSIDVSTLPAGTSYVRAEVFNANHGVLYTQPFGIQVQGSERALPTLQSVRNTLPAVSVSHGAAVSEIGLRLHGGTSVTARVGTGPVITRPVTINWTMPTIDRYNPAVTNQNQTFTVNGVVRLPTGINGISNPGNAVSLNVSMQVTVLKDCTGCTTRSYLVWNPNFQNRTVTGNNVGGDLGIERRNPADTTVAFSTTADTMRITNNSSPLVDNRGCVRIHTTGTSIAARNAGWTRETAFAPRAGITYRISFNASVASGTGSLRVVLREGSNSIATHTVDNIGTSSQPISYTWTQIGDETVEIDTRRTPTGVALNVTNLQIHRVISSCIDVPAGRCYRCERSPCICCTSCREPDCRCCDVCGNFPCTPNYHPVWTPNFTGQTVNTSRAINGFGVVAESSSSSLAIDGANLRFAPIGTASSAGRNLLIHVAATNSAWNAERSFVSVPDTQYRVTFMASVASGTGAVGVRGNATDTFLSFPLTTTPRLISLEWTQIATGTLQINTQSTALDNAIIISGLQIGSAVGCFDVVPDCSRCGANPCVCPPITAPPVTTPQTPPTTPASTAAITTATGGTPLVTTGGTVTGITAGTITGATPPPITTTAGDSTGTPPPTTTGVNEPTGVTTAITQTGTPGSSYPTTTPPPITTLPPVTLTLPPVTNPPVTQPGIIAPNPILGESLPVGRVGQEYNVRLETGGSEPLVWEVLGGYLQDGLTFSNGVISGTPTQYGVFYLAVRVSNESGVQQAILTVDVLAPLVVTTTGSGGVVTPPPATTTSESTAAPIPGDVDGNGIVTILDALEILMKLAGMESVAPDDVTINDALDILMHLAGMPSDMRIYGG
jgi:hypothetical protein